MENRLGFGSEVGNSDTPLKLPFVNPTTDEHHAVNAREIETRVNRIKTQASHLYAPSGYISIPGDGTWVDVQEVRVAKGWNKFEAVIYGYSAGTVDSLGLDVDTVEPITQSWDLGSVNSGDSNRIYSAIYAPRATTGMLKINGVTLDLSDIDPLAYTVVITPLIAFIK